MLLKDRIIEWHIKKYGKERGCWAHFAEEIQRSQPTVYSYIHGGKKPGDEVIPLMAKVLGVQLSVFKEEIMEQYKSIRELIESQAAHNLKEASGSGEWERYEFVAKREMRDVIGLARWLLSMYVEGRVRITESPEAGDVYEADVSVKGDLTSGMQKGQRILGRERSHAAGGADRP